MVDNMDGNKNLMDDLAFYIREGNAEQIQVILHALNPCDVPDDSVTLLLHIASECENSSIVKYLIDWGCKVDAVDNYGNTPLILALLKNHENIAVMLIEASASILIRNKKGESAAKLIFNNPTMAIPTLDICLKKVKEECLNDSLQTAKVLFEACCPLPYAIRLADPIITKYMLENGCDVEEKEPHQSKWRALHEAVSVKDLESVKLLISYKANVNAEDSLGRRPLTFARDKVFLEILLNHGAQLITDGGNLVNSDFFHRGSKKTVEMLMQYHPHLTAKSIVSKTPLIFDLVLNEKFDPVDILRENISDSFDINIRDYLGSTPLMLAALAGSFYTVKFLLEKGAEVNAANKDGHTALYYALRPPKNKKIRKAKKQGVTVVFFAIMPPESKEIQKARAQIVMLLLEYGANVQYINSVYKTALYPTLFDLISRDKTYQMAKFILTYLAIEEVLGRKVDGFILTKINANTMFANYYNYSKAKIENMKRVKICESVSLFELLVASKDEIACLSSNEQLVSQAKSMVNYKHCSKLFCYNILRKKIMEIVKQANT